MWIVEAESRGGGEYLYLVDAPETVRPTDVACLAYAQHGVLYRAGEVQSYLGPTYVARWQEVVKWETV
jgi:hypothetical protein